MDAHPLRLQCDRTIWAPVAATPASPLFLVRQKKATQASQLRNLALVHLHDLRNSVDHVARQGASLSQLFPGNLARTTVDMNRGAGGFKSIHSLGEQGNRDSRENIAGPRLCERAVAGAVHVDALSIRDDGAMTLEDDD